MAAYTPPKKGTDPTPQTGNPFVGERRDGPTPTGKEADDVAARAAPALHAWVSGQRQNVANSIADFHRGTFDHPDISASYTNIQGRESLTVSPKVTASSQQQDEASSRSKPNDLVRLARQEVVTPSTPLYLMVLFKKDSIAAVEMSDLSNPSVAYTGVSKKSRWTRELNTRITILQADFGGTEFVLLPLDLTGQASAQRHYLSTNALGDNVETDAPGAAMPVFNGNRQQIFTVGGAFSYTSTGGFRLIDDIAYDLRSNLPFTPTAIDGSGIAYYVPQIQATCSITLDATSLAAFHNFPSLNDQVSKYESAIGATAETASVYSAATMEDLTVEEARKGSVVRSDFTTTQTTFATIYTFSTGPFKVKGSICGYCYSASAYLSEVPTVKNYKASISGIVSDSFDGTDFNIVRTDAAGPVLALDFPLMSYSRQGLSVMFMSASATQTQQDDEQFDMSKMPGAVTPSGLVIDLEWGDSNGAPPASDSYTYTSHSRQINSFNLVQRPPGPYSKAVADKFVQDVISAFKATGNVQGGTRQVSGSLVITTHLPDPPNLSAPLASIPKGQPEANYISASFGYSGPGGYYSQTGYACLNLPLRYPTKGTRHITSHATIFGETLKFDSDGSFSTALAPFITVHAFPPMIRDLPYYTRNDPPAVKVVTPYDDHQSKDPGAFEPWLHISTKEIVLQGYAVDKTPHVYMGVGERDWLPKLAKALKCEPADIVTMVADVTLAKIKAVAGVKPPVY